MFGRVVLVVLALLAGTAGANVGKPWSEGEPAGEPGGIRDIAITREELVIDLRPLADGDRVVVSATYHLDNTGGAQQLDLVFATGSLSSKFRITLDGVAVAGAETSGLALPESWKPPTSTPGFDGGPGHSLELVDPPTIAFRLAITPGKHDLAVTYRAVAMLDHNRDPTVLRQFAYVLSPARTWAGFGGLDLTVHVPDDWRVAITPALKREGGTLRGTFSSIPADHVAITVQAPFGAHGAISIATLILFAIVALGGPFAIGFSTRARERHHLAAARLTSGWSALGFGAAWAAAFLTTGLVAVFTPNLALPAAQVDHYGYGDAFAIVGVVLGTFVALVIGWIVSAVVRGRMNGGNDPPDPDVPRL